MIHVAVLMKRFLDLVLSGEKTVECRLTRDAREPYQCIEVGERIYFKQSGGPYRATAVAEHVVFESGLTPGRIRQLKRDYDDVLCGEPEFWRWKRNARFCTLIWLTAVEPTSSGPDLAPLQGRAWIVLRDEPAWRRVEPSSECFAVPLTGGSVRNGSVLVRDVLDRFPASALGGTTKRRAGRPITLMLHDGPTVQSDIVASRHILRTRVWKRWFADHGVRAGDRVVFTPVDRQTFFVGLARAER
jgi:ASC-1-like (ASCH) protein